MTASPMKVAEQLGGLAVLRRKVQSDMDLVAIVREGLPPESVDALAQKMGLSKEDVFRLIVPRRTLAARKAQHARLNAEESEKITRMARIFALTAETFQNTQKAQAWLRRPSRPLGGQVPLDLLDTEAGARLVEDELIRISYGVYA